MTPTGVAGLTFQDEADAANRAVQQLEAPGRPHLRPRHPRGRLPDDGAALNGCAGNLAGSPIVDIASRLDPSIKVIVSAHTHAEYRCTITTGGVTRLITSASSFGRVLTDITLTVNDKTGELVAASAENVIVDERAQRSGPGRRPDPDPTKADPQVQAVVEPVRDGVGAARQPGDRADPGRPHADRSRVRRVGARRRDRRCAVRRDASRSASAVRSSPS